MPVSSVTSYGAKSGPWPQTLLLFLECLFPKQDFCSLARKPSLP
ncbi:hypothetical protein DA2_1159 [Desulfovibrio sp. A2]|nr:hypothetical protein DA2_1159 [Desulfovibrio sp. A2]